MEMLHLTCPDCGAAMTVLPDGKSAVCEFCGHRALLQKEQKTETKTETQKMIERLREERAQAERNPSPAATPDELRGGILAAISAAVLRWRYRVRQAVRYIVFLAAAVAAGLLIYRFLPAEYYAYLPVAGVVLVGAGIFCVTVSFSSFRSLPLGLGVGALAVWLMQLTGTLK